jgi:hypothetical protein
MGCEQIDDDQRWMLDPLLLLERLFVKRYQIGQDPVLRATFSNMNFAFFQTRNEGENSFGGQDFQGSPLYNHLIRLAKVEPTPQNKEVVAQLRDWADRNIFMTNDVWSQLGLPRMDRRSG